MFHTSTKECTGVLPKERLRDICAAVKVPVVAIGGIKKSNIEQLAGTGVDGVALVSAILILMERYLILCIYGPMWEKSIFVL